MGYKKVGGKSKKILSAALAFVMIFSSGVGLKNYYSKQQTPTSVSDGNDVNNGNDDSKEETFSPEGVLYKPYSIKNDDEIQNMLNEVEKLTGEKIDIRFIKILFYEYLDQSNVLTKDDFKDISEDEFHKWFMDQQKSLYNALAYGTTELQNLKQVILDGEGDDVIKSYHEKLLGDITFFLTFIPKEAPGYNSVYLDLSKLLVKEKNDIESINKDEFAKNTKEILDKMKEIIEDKSLSMGGQYIFMQGMDPILPILSPSLDRNNKDNCETYKESIPNFQSEIATAIYNECLVRIRYTLPVSEETCTNRAKENEQYIDSDANAANKNKPNGSTKNVPGNKDSNGKHDTSKERVSSATTVQNEDSSVVDVPDKEDTTHKNSGGNQTGTTNEVTKPTEKVTEWNVLPGEMREFSMGSPKVDDVKAYVYIDDSNQNDYESKYIIEIR